MSTQMDEQMDTQRGKYLTFLVDSGVYGLDISCITEIIDIQQITALPESREYLKGVINLRGRIIPVIDMRSRLRRPETAYHDRTCIIVVETQGVTAGLIVDSVVEVETIDDENIVPPPSGVGSGQSQFIKGIGKSGNDVKLLIDLSLLLQESSELVKLLTA